VTHGGALMTLLDVTMATAARSAACNPDMGVVTIEMKTSFMRAQGELARQRAACCTARQHAWPSEGTVFDATAG
jgi:acyl-coenzyme A thioesterase PaaI-like protein